MNPFLLEIGVENGKVVVRKKRDHAWNANGDTKVGWKVNGKKFADWTVDFPPDRTPFANGETHFEKQGPKWGKLKSHKGGPATYSYDVTCTDKQGTCYKSDPEVVVWPD